MVWICEELLKLFLMKNSWPRSLLKRPGNSIISLNNSEIKIKADTNSLESMKKKASIGKYFGELFFCQGQ